MFREAVARKDPVLFVVSMLDKEHASFDHAYESIKARLTPNVIPVEVPIGEGADLPRHPESLLAKGAPL